MIIANLLRSLLVAGQRLTHDADGIELVGSTGVPDAATVASLRAHRPELELLIANSAVDAALPPVVRYVTARTDLEAVARDVKQRASVGFDVETTGLDPMHDSLRLVQIALPGGPTYVLDLPALGDLGPVADALAGVEVVGHNVGFDLAFAAQHLGVRPRAVWCTLTAARLLEGGRPPLKGFFTLQEVVRRELGIELPKDEQTSNWSGSVSVGQVEYAARDAAVAVVLRDALRDQLERAGLAAVAALEFELIPVLVDMRRAGLGFDAEAWGRLLRHREGRAEALRTSLQRDLGSEVGGVDGVELNPRSRPQVLAALQRLGVCARGTSKDHLAPYASVPAVSALLQYRSLASFLAGPGKALPAAASEARDGRIRPRLDPLAAPTGRFGCSHPNLQGLEKARGPSDDSAAIPDARACIVPSEGHVFVDADYAAIELRVLAAITGDARLQTIFRDGGDPHRAMAALVARKAEHEVTKDERNRAKAVNFGFMFGMGPDRFVEYARSGYGVTFTLIEARQFKAAWERTFPGVVAWQRRVGNASPGVMVSRSGRRRVFESRQTGYCERLNMPVQGTAADGLKLAMVLLQPRLHRYKAQIVLCVHDELLVETPREHAVEVCEIVRATMVEGMQRFVTEVPIVVEADVRATWSASSNIEVCNG